MSDFARYSVGGNTWMPLAPLPVKVGWGGSLTRVGRLHLRHER